MMRPVAVEIVKIAAPVLAEIVSLSLVIGCIGVWAGIITHGI